MTNKKTHMNIIEMNGEELAKWLHDTYESIAKIKGWETQQKTQVQFRKLPKKNQSVMLNLAQCIQVNLAVGLIKVEEKTKSDTLAHLKEEIEKFKEIHIHPNQKKLDYYDKWETSGCRFCYINRKLNEVLALIKAEQEKT